MVAPSFISVGPAVTTDETPTRQYRKDVIAVGHYKHPTHEWEANITADELDRLVGVFDQMQANGVDVEITVDHSFSADDIVGYARSMYVEGDRLVALVEMRGQRGIDLAETVRNVSVEIEPNFTDGKGRTYGDAITAISIVQSPVVPDQSEFVAASLRQVVRARWGRSDEWRDRVEKHFGNRQPLLLSWNAGAGAPGDQTMTVEEALKLVGAATGIEDLTPDNAEERLQEFGAARKASADEVKKLKEDVAAKTAALDEAKKALKAAEDGAKEASLIDDDTAEDRAEPIVDRLDALKGKTVTITPEVVEKLSASLVGVRGARPKLLLARGAESAPPVSRQIVDAIVGAPEALTPKKFSTGSQDGDGDGELSDTLKSELTNAAFGPSNTDK